MLGITLVVFLYIAAPVLILLFVKRATEAEVESMAELACPFVLMASGNVFTISNPTRSSRISLSVGVALLLPTALFFYISAGIGFYMLPLGLLGLVLLTIGLRSKDVLQTVIDSADRTVTFIYSPSVFSAKGRKRTIPFSQLSLVLVEFSRPSSTPRLTSPGCISVTVTGQQDYVCVFEFAFTQQMQNSVIALMPEIRQTATEIGQIMGLKVALDIPPQSSYTSEEVA